MDTRQTQNALRRLGWSHLEADGVLGAATKQAVADYQRGFGWWDLTADGNPGPATQHALEGSLHALDVGQGSASPHFSFAEFTCKGPLERGCRRIVLLREQIRSLEAYRAAIGHGIRIVSGYRCPPHNARVGGAKDSQHMYGGAADVDELLPLARVRNLHVFAGIGFQASNGLVRHVDRRDVSGHNNGGSTATPMTWDYPG